MRYTIRYEWAGRDHFVHTDEFDTARAVAIALVGEKQTAIEVWTGAEQCGGFDIDWLGSKKPMGTCFPTGKEYAAHVKRLHDMAAGCGMR